MPIRQQGYQICPFFVKESELSVTCEGVIPGVACTQRFAASKQRAEHQRRYCNSYDYSDCPWAAMLTQAAESGALDGYRCGLSGDGCPCSRPERGMCCAYCERRAHCPAPIWWCENDPGKCGYLKRGGKLAKPIEQEPLRQEVDAGETGTLFDFL